MYIGIRFNRTMEQTLYCVLLNSKEGLKGTAVVLTSRETSYSTVRIYTMYTSF